MNGSAGGGEGARKLGGLRGTEPTTHLRERSTDALRKRAEQRAADLLPVIARAQATSCVSLRAIAADLNARRIS